MKRKLTAIFCADGVAFGKLMEADEDAAMASLQRRREIMRELFEKHDGRQVNTWGDAIIIATQWFIFPSIPFAFHIWRRARKLRRSQGPET